MAKPPSATRACDLRLGPLALRPGFFLYGTRNSSQVFETFDLDQIRRYDSVIGIVDLDKIHTIDSENFAEATSSRRRIHVLTSLPPMKEQCQSGTRNKEKSTTDINRRIVEIERNDLRRRCNSRRVCRRYWCRHGSRRQRRHGCGDLRRPRCRHLRRWHRRRQLCRQWTRNHRWR